jgi:hypothetical protein
VSTITSVTYGLFECRACIESDQGDDCGDHCATSWPEELPPLGSDWWASCKCCGAPASLVAPLLAV